MISNLYLESKLSGFLTFNSDNHHNVFTFQSITLTANKSVQQEVSKEKPVSSSSPVSRANAPSPHTLNTSTAAGTTKRSQGQLLH